ncbi:hypothetical protein QBC43DRAFT_323227 [Cladorrhinum sp. PSN259]|nr:hypothetical protein QBC43DRAFT_323227 [Cladorrhinum sp. PSN259]
MQPTMTRSMHLLAFFALGLLSLGNAQGPDQGSRPVNLGGANNYAIFAADRVLSIGENPYSSITGNIGVWPGHSGGESVELIDFPDGKLVGTKQPLNLEALRVRNDLSDAFTEAYTRIGGIEIEVGDIGDSPFSIPKPGYYYRADGNGPGDLDLGSDKTLILDAQGDPNAVWIFKIRGNFNIRDRAVIELRNKAQACNVFFLVQGRLIIGTRVIAQGKFLVGKDILVEGIDSTLEGSLFSLTSSVTLRNTAINRPTCATSTIPRGTCPVCPVCPNPPHYPKCPKRKPCHHKPVFGESEHGGWESDGFEGESREGGGWSGGEWLENGGP